jgi:uncharacterized protein (TIGR03083 family)
MSDSTPVDAIAPLDHDEAMALAAAEYERLLSLVDTLSDHDWASPTDCTGWTVKDILGHMLGMLELQADPSELRRQVTTAAQLAANSGRLRLDELTALQVREHDHMTPTALTDALHEAAPRGLAARAALPADRRATPYDPELPGEHGWTLGYLFDIIHTRDPWLHRIDICRATGREPVLTAEHDGRLIADVVADWAPRHRHPFELHLTGPAGGRYRNGVGGTELDLDAVQFCRTLSGREQGTGPLATQVPF